MDGRRRGGWAKEGADLARASSGAFLFGIPLLYTMELWRVCSYVPLWKLLLFLVVAFAANLALGYFIGFRPRCRSAAEAVAQAIEAVAVGVVGSVALLAAIGRIGPGQPLASMLSTVVVKTVPLSIGASVAGATFTGKDRTGGGEQPRGTFGRVALQDLGATVVGGAFIGMTLAPTAEIVVIANSLDYVHALALVGLSLAITYAIVFESGFRRRGAGGGGQGLFQGPISETVAAYAISLLVAALLLYLFGRIGPGGSLAALLSRVLVLGLPTAVGGAAGRVLV